MTPDAQFLSQVYSLLFPMWCLSEPESGGVPSRGGVILKLVVVRSYFPFSTLVNEDRLTGSIVSLSRLRREQPEPPPNPKAKDGVGSRDPGGF